MPPNFKVTREEIIAAALKILKEQGKNSITSREIALELGVSTRPIYSFFPSMDDLLEEVSRESMQMLSSYIKSPYTSDPFLNIGVGYVLFGKDHPQVFSFLLEKYPGLGTGTHDNNFSREHITQLKSEPFYSLFSDVELESIFLKMEIFTYGLMNYFRSGTLDYTKEKIIDVLEEMGEAVITLAVKKKIEKGELLPTDPRLSIQVRK